MYRMFITDGTLLLCAVVVCAGVAGSSIAATDTLPATEPAEWQAPAPEAVEAEIRSWLTESAASSDEGEQRIAAAEPLLQQLYSMGDRLDIVVACLAIGSESIAEVIDSANPRSLQIASLDWLDSSDVPEFVRSNVRLYAGRALVRHNYFEQALRVLDGVAIDSACDPASLLFYRSVAEHQLVKLDRANKSLDALLDSDQEMPLRFAQLGRLMKSDIAPVEEDSLDHIARRMSDVRRRLRLGEADERTQEVERGILVSLDKMIEQLEEQQRRRQQQQQQQQSGGQPSGQPMQDSQIAEQKGEGKVDIKDIGDSAGWGDLPPRERERVLQQIGRDFPGHYRDLMEEYLKRLATDEREEEER